MLKIKIFLSVFIISILLGVTSLVKTQTRLLEKKIEKAEIKIAILEKDLHEIELDYSYLSSPQNLSNKIKDLAVIDYVPFDYSRIFLNYEDFILVHKKLSNLKKNEKKTKK